MTQQTQGIQQNAKGELVQMAAPTNSSLSSLNGPLQYRTAELMRILSDQETGATYKHGLRTTLNLLKVTVALLFHLVLKGFALVVWIWGIGFQLGYYFRKWIEVTGPSADEIVCAFLWGTARPFVLLHQWATSFLNLEDQDPLSDLKQHINEAPAKTLTSAHPAVADKAEAIECEVHQG
jgi:hypothetical protein